MRFVDEYRDPAAARQLTAEIAAACPTDRPLRIMEVCGGHTHALYRHGLTELLPDGLTLVHGPGCPVCVLPMGRIDDAIALADHPGVTLATFGDLMRVPGGNGSFLDARARGADIRTVYSPTDALRLARDHPDREVVFVAIGFETTAPSTARTVQEAAAAGISNFSVFSNHVTILPAMQAILDSPGERLDGFLGPGHVATVIGCAPFAFVTERYRRPVVIAGFEPLDLLDAILRVVRLAAAGRAEVENQYGRVVTWDGNPRALATLADVFELRPFFEWRGLGTIAHSALSLRDRYAGFDAERRYSVPGVRVADPKACQCGEVLKGVLRPWECKVFGTACTPETPIGTCMVSSEGACAAVYTYGRVELRRTRRAGAPA